jgi:hypothetical protein
MKKWEFIVDSDEDEKRLIEALARWKRKGKSLVTIQPYRKNRSLAQNSLFAVWCRQRGEQTGHGETHERCYLKLTYGVPIMEQHPDFAELWAPYRQQPYELQMNAMKIVDVTSLMLVDEMTEFLNHVELDSYEHGLALTKPRQYDEAMNR